MSIPLTVNGITYQYPQFQDEGWGPDATKWAVAINQGTLQKSGGLFSLTADVDFGAAFGIKSLYYKTRSSNIATTGNFRLANTDLIVFRNAGNTGNLNFGTGSSDAIPAWNGVDLVNLTATQTLSNKTFVAPIITGNLTVNGNIAATGTITGSNLSGTNTGDVTIGTANGLSLVGQVLSLGLSSTSTTGALSSTDWNTFNNKQPAGSYITALTGDVTASGPGSSVATVAFVGGSTASAVNSATILANAATSANTASTIVRRDASGNFSASTITANLIGNATNVTGIVAIANGGTGQTTANAGFNALSPMTTLGDTIYGGASGVGTRLPIGSSGQVLTVSGGGIPSWSTPAASGVTSLNGQTGALSLVAGTNITIIPGAGTLTINASGTGSFPLLAPDGSSAAPSYSFSGETSLGIYRPTAGDLGIAQGGNLIARFGNGRALFNIELRASAGNVSVPNYSFTDGEPDKGMYDVGAGIIGFATGGVNRLNISSTSIEAKSVIYAPDGLAASPGYSFTNDTDTGIVRGGSGILDFVSNGSTVLATNPTKIQNTVPFASINGTASAPAYSFDSDLTSGMYLIAAGQVGLSAATVLNITLTSTSTNFSLPIYAQDGSPSAPGYSFTNDSDTGIARGGSGIMNFIANGSTVFATNSTLVQSSALLGVSLGIDFTQIATPSNPAASHNKLYFKSDNNLYKLTSGGVETVFSTGGTGDINNGGNAFGSGITIGTTDNFGLSFITNNITALSFTNAQVASFTSTVNLLAQSELRLQDTAGGQYVGLRASSTQTTYTITLPASAPATNTFLEFNGTNYVWATASGSGDINNGGNAFGSDITIGTTDAFNTSLIANNTIGLTLDTSSPAPTVSIFGLLKLKDQTAAGFLVVDGDVGATDKTLTFQINPAGSGVTLSMSANLTVGPASATLQNQNFGDVTLGAFNNTQTATGLDLTGAYGQILHLTQFDATHPGGVPLSGGGTTNFLRADGTWAAPTASVTFPLLGPTDNASAPNYSWSADTDTGMFTVGANNISFATGGVERLRIGPTGNLSVVDNATIRLFDATSGNSNFISFRSAATLTASYSLILPATGPATNTFLKFDGTDYVWAASLSLAAIGSTPNANGATFSGVTLNLEPASASFGGVVTTSAQTFAGSKTFTSPLTVNSGGQNTLLVQRYTNAGDGTGSTGMRVGNSGASQGDAQFFYTNAAATGAPTSTWTFTPRNNADTTNTDAVRITLQKTAGNDGGEYTLQTATTGGTLTNAIFVNNAQLVSISTGDLAVSTEGKGLQIKEGSNAKMGISTLVTGTVTVSTTAVTASSRIFLTGQNSSGVHGELTVSARTAGTSFVITSSSAADTRDIAWMLVEPA